MFLGDIQLDCYQLPNGCYKLSVNQIAKACNLDPKRLPELFELKSLKPLLPDGLAYPDLITKMKVETSDGIRQASLIDLNYASLIWRKCNTIEGERLVDACLVEALERRADAAFGVDVSEDERQERFRKIVAPLLTVKERKIRQKSLDKLVYKPHSSIGTNLGKESTIKINLAVFGQKHFKCQRTKYMDKDTQAAIGEIELFIFHQHLQRPTVAIEQIVDEAIEIHKNAYGDLYFLPENKAASVS